MPSLADEITKQVATRNGVLYTIATALGALGIVAALYDPIKDIVDKKSTGTLRPVTAILLAASFLLKTPYMKERNAALSFVICFAWGAGWMLVFVVCLTASLLNS